MKKYYGVKIGDQAFICYSHREYIDKTNGVKGVICKGFNDLNLANIWLKGDECGIFYAVRVGRQPGIYTNVEDYLKNTSGYPNYKAKKFKFLEQAKAYMRGEVVSSKSSTKSRGSKKYYAVRNGNKPGIYESAEEFKQQQKGFKEFGLRCFQGKSFKTLEEAEEYMAAGPSDFLINQPIEFNDADAVAYVDGSYSKSTNLFASSVVICCGDEITTISKRFSSDAEFSEFGSVAGEINAAKMAMQWAVENNKANIVICYDFNGIEDWYHEIPHSNSDISCSYNEFCKTINKKVKVSFSKVKSHSGNEINNIVDRLAKQTLYL